MTIAHDITRAIAHHRPRSDLRKQHIALTTEQLAKEAETTDAIARHVQSIMTGVQELDRLIAHDEQAFQLARADRPDLELTLSRLARIIESLK
jgi:hypothetical protein